MELTSLIAKPPVMLSDNATRPPRAAGNEPEPIPAAQAGS
jgi:hypothetical protein